MLVKDRMTTELFTITPDTTVSDALGIMRQHNVRRLPVMNKRQRLVGIVSEKDLLYASPSPATSLSVYEIGYLLSKLSVGEIMAQDIVSIGPDNPLEEAARVMIDSQVGGLPVLDGHKLVGIVTETDIFKTLLEILGAREPGVRLTLQAPDERGVLRHIANAIADLGGNIIALGTFCAEDASDGRLMCKVSGVDKDALVAALEDTVVHVIDARDL